MSTVYRYVCTRQNDDGIGPATYACTLELTDNALIGSSGTWKADGVSPQMIFIARTGEWRKGPGLITLDSLSGALEERVLMQNPDANAGKLKGDGLVGGHVVDWQKT
jgi:hypothetical protein